MKTRNTTARECKANRVSELCAALSEYDDGTGDLGIIVRQALADDPQATVEDVREIIVEAREDAARESFTGLYLITQDQAEHLMMAPSVAGGWCAVFPDCRDAVCGECGSGADIVALLPAGMFDHYKGRAVARSEALRIAAALDRAAQHPVVSDDGSECAGFAGKIRSIVG